MSEIKKSEKRRNWLSGISGKRFQKLMESRNLDTSAFHTYGLNSEQISNFYKLYRPSKSVDCTSLLWQLSASLENDPKSTATNFLSNSNNIEALFHIFVDLNHDPRMRQMAAFCLLILSSFESERKLATRLAQNLGVYLTQFLSLDETFATLCCLILENLAKSKQQKTRDILFSQNCHVELVSFVTSRCASGTELTEDTLRVLFLLISRDELKNKSKIEWMLQSIPNFLTWMIDMIDKPEISISIDRATDSTLLDPHWENILICVDSVKSGEVVPKQALPLIRKRYRNENPHVRHHALLVLEAMVKNCGENFHREIATKEFMEDLKHLAEESSSEKVKDKILELIQCWAHAFRSKAEYKIVVDTHNLMKLEGYTFPPLREADAMFDAESAPEWLDSNTCHRCSVEFGLLTRKHHCRNCGQVFCDKCSSRTLPLPHIGIETDVRVCETCFDVLRNKMASGTSKPSGSKNEANSSSEADLKLAKEKSLQDVDKLNEEEDLQMALAISQSEAEEKERQKQRQAFGFNGIFSTNHTNKTDESKEQSKSTGYTGTQEPILNPNLSDNSDTDGELTKYLNRGYWEARRTDQKKGILRNSPTPSAPVAPISDNNVAEVVLNGKGTNGQYNISNESPVAETFSLDTSNLELTSFIEKLRSNIEVFVNRIRNDVIRGRSIVTDSSVQAMFVNLTTMHAQLLQHMSSLEDRRGYYESLQDKLAQIKDAREAVDALREEHVQRRQEEYMEVQRQRQMQMAVKLDVMRQKKHEMLEQQRLLAMQRIEEQRRELEMRRQIQMQHQHQMAMPGMLTQAQSYVPQDGPFASLYQMGSTLPPAVTQMPYVSYPQPMSYQQAPVNAMSPHSYAQSRTAFEQQTPTAAPAVAAQPFNQQQSSMNQPISHSSSSQDFGAQSFAPPPVQNYPQPPVQNYPHQSNPYSSMPPSLLQQQQPMVQSDLGHLAAHSNVVQSGYYVPHPSVYPQQGLPPITGSAAYSGPIYGGQPSSIGMQPAYYYSPPGVQTCPPQAYPYPNDQQPPSTAQNGHASDTQLISFD